MLDLHGLAHTEALAGAKFLLYPDLAIVQREGVLAVRSLSQPGDFGVEQLRVDQGGLGGGRIFALLIGNRRCT